MSYSKNNGFDAIFKLFYNQIPGRFRIFATLQEPLAAVRPKVGHTVTMEMPHYFSGKGAFNFFPTFAGLAQVPR